MKESTKKLLKTLGAMGFCAILSGAAGKGVDIAKDKFVNSEPKPDDGHTPTEEELAELVEASPEKTNSEESMIEEIIEESTEEVKEEKED